MVRKKRQSKVCAEGSSTDSSEDKSLSPTAGESCQHGKKSVDIAKLRKLLKSSGLALDCPMCKKTAEEAKGNLDSDDIGYEYDDSLWICLKCGTQLCGRSRNQHAIQHFKTPHSDSHALTMNTRSFEIWCYECDNEVAANSRKNLLECIEIVKKNPYKQPPSSADNTPQKINNNENKPQTSSDDNTPQKINNNENKSPPASAVNTPPPIINNIENKVTYALAVLKPFIPADDNGGSRFVNNKKAIPLPPPAPPIPGVAKRIDTSEPPKGSNSKSTTTSATNTHEDTTFRTTYTLPRKSSISGIAAPNSAKQLPRVRGLTNLGNTCFFNAVIQCLAQTPYLLDVLKESSAPGEEFILPGGSFKFKDDEDLKLPMIKGTLSSWGGLTAALANTLEELQSGGGVFSPGRLFDKLCAKCPQFRGGDQHDSHELLRHLLESVRSEDLKRYQRVILQNLGFKDQDINKVSEEMRQKCKIYGNQAADRILRPEQVFRGFLVSTLTCQDCFNVSSRHENFLDMSLPVSVEKPQPPQRRKSSPENPPVNSFYLHPAPVVQTKSQQKKDKEKDRKAKRAAKYQTKKLVQKLMLDDVVSGASEDANYFAENCYDVMPSLGCATREECTSESSSSTQQSDADVEDNLIDDRPIDKTTLSATTRRCEAPPTLFDRNGNNSLPMVPTEKCGDSPENIDKDSLDEDENADSGIAISPAVCGGSSGSYVLSSETNDGSANNSAMCTSLCTMGLSGKGANIVRQLTSNPSIDTVQQEQKPTNAMTNGEITAKLEKLQLNDRKAARMKAKRVRTQSHSDWSTTIAPRYQCEDGECSVQSCLNNFTSVELMAGNNKVGCEQCTKRVNGNDPNAKTVNTNATKQFLISSPPAVLILHLKRFQLGPRYMFRKLTRSVNFPMVLDVAPFCGSKVKNLPNIDRKQKKLLYALYGVVEHSGSMYGGHYTAYVKVRPKLTPEDKRWKFIPQGSKAELDQDDEQRKKLEELSARRLARDLRMKQATDSDDFSSSSTSSSDSEANTNAFGAARGEEEAQNVQVPPGKWYYVSDSRVQEVNEDAVLKAQAYLLFYERIY